MAFSAKKEAAIRKAIDAATAVYNARGTYYPDNGPIPYPYGQTITGYKHMTIAQIENYAEGLLNVAASPMEPATEKQLNYLRKLFESQNTGYDNLLPLLDHKLNKYQASELIALSRACESIMFDRMSGLDVFGYYEDMGNQYFEWYMNWFKEHNL